MTVLRRSPFATASLLLIAALPLGAQQYSWQTRATFYADNTEFFTPYRVGETILGGQVSTWLADQPGPRTTLRLGVFADRRWGSSAVADSVKPILAFRYQTRHALGVFGTLETVNRHGLLEPLMVTTRELTTPIEYGGQWIENAGPVHAESWINWQKLNTPTQREQFEIGNVLRVNAGKYFDLQGQHLWYHRGGQLFNPVPVTNNHAEALGAEAHDSLGWLGPISLAAWALWSQGHIDPDTPPGRPDHGHGTYLRASINPWNWAEVFAIHWIGQDYNGDDGDNNYNSTGYDPTFYQPHRVYTEIGMIRRTPIEGGVTFDAEFRFHNIDNLKSIAFFNTHWEISYRLVIRAPMDVILGHRHVTSVPAE
ncbi:MAG TPA: hypothetical protein VGM20_07555 [Gemmatimonadales bacterium]